MKNELIMQNFAQGIKSKNQSSFSEFNNNNCLVVYSYGYHFPMAIKLIGGFVVNKNKYSSATSRHQTLVKNNIYGKIIYMTTLELIKLTKTDITDINEVIEGNI